MAAESISTLPAWKKLERHQGEISRVLLNDLFANNPERATDFSIEVAPLFIDYSKQPVNHDTINLLLELAEASGLKARIEDLFNGQVINRSENRPALHHALRSKTDHQVFVEEDNVHSLVMSELAHMEAFIKRLHSGDIKGFTGKSINTLVNIGIGGSDLGPRLATQALHAFADGTIQVHFVANIDKQEIDAVLERVDPEQTLFIVASKSFTSLETITNANTTRDWLARNGAENPCNQILAVTGKPGAAKAYGIRKENIFRIWDWVGGRYSLWSAIGLPVAAAIGINRFQDLLSGAEKMDHHFRETSFNQNIPVMLGLLDIWHINFFGSETLAIIPYDQSLALLPDYLSQLFMESNGKRVKQSGEFVDYNTGAIIWGGIGTNCQHAFMQLLHQGTHYIPAEFLVASRANENNIEYQRLLFSSCIAQGEALMHGNQGQEGISNDQLIQGNHPSITIIYESVTPETLGMLLAMYEHRTFVQACIWGINPFDQWGVELGKKITHDISATIEGKSVIREFDSSTRQLIDRFSKE